MPRPTDPQPDAGSADGRASSEGLVVPAEDATDRAASSASSAVRVVATTMLKPDARARLSEQLGPGFLVLDIRKAPSSADIIISPVVSPQTIAALKQLFPRARVVLAEVEDRDLKVSFPGPVRRAVDGGADGYVVAGDLAELAHFAASDARLALNPGQAGQLGPASVRALSADELVLNELKEMQGQGHRELE